MFLPVLLVRDYGLWGFVVFAVPNVLGAAAMGWVLRRPGHSKRFVDANRAVCIAFSFVTIAFQIYFLIWLRSTLDPHAGSTLLFVISTAAVGLAGLLCLVSPRLWLLLAGAVLVVSVFALFQSATTGALFREASTQATSPFVIAALTASCVFGFVLCPYLDLTFHRARSALPGPVGTAAFFIGFLLMFQLILIYALGYATMGDTALQLWLELRTQSVAAGLLVVHILVQLIFTIWVHADELRSQLRRPWIALVAIVIFVLSGAAEISGGIGIDPLGEIVYRLFMGFYGLVFPAYVWLCMIPTRDGHTGLGGPVGVRKLQLWIASVLAAAPVFWMGFIERQTGWLIPALAVVLLSRLFIPGGRGFGRLPPGPSGAPVPAPTHPPQLHAHATPAQDPPGV